MGFGKDGNGIIIVEDRTQALGTLAQNTGIIVGSELETLERFRILKSEVFAVMRAVTNTEGGGFGLYLVDGDLTLSEAEAAIENNGPLGPNDSVSADVSERFVRLVGVTEIKSQAVDVPFLDVNTGAPVCMAKPRWTFSRDKAWNWLVYNNGQSPTTGIVVVVKAKHFGVWVT